MLLKPMGWTSEMVAAQFKVSREKQDYYALISHSRAEAVRGCIVFNIVRVTYILIIFRLRRMVSSRTRSFRLKLGDSLSPKMTRSDRG